MSRYYFSSRDTKEFFDKHLPDSSKKTIYAREVVNNIIKNFPGDVTQAKTARLLKRSPKTIQRTCKKAFNTSFKELIAMLRIYIVLKLLQETALENVEISIQLNYPAYTSMNRDFRKFLGISPSKAKLELMHINYDELFRERIRVRKIKSKKFMSDSVN